VWTADRLGATANSATAQAQFVSAVHFFGAVISWLFAAALRAGIAGLLVIM